MFHDQAGVQAVKIDTEPVELMQIEREALRRIAWELDIGGPMARNGTCVLHCLTKALDRIVEEAKEMFIRGVRDPQRIDHIIETLSDSGITANEVGPEGFGYREHRRLVALDGTDASKSGQMILAYENAEGSSIPVASSSRYRIFC